MQRRIPVFVTLVSLAASLASAASAEEAVPEAENGRERPTGIITHGGNSAFVEDFYGGRVEKMPPEPGRTTGKHDPGLRWNGTPSGR